MLRTHWQYSAKGAVEYLTAADYFASSPGELLGKGYEHLDIGNMLPRDVLHCLAHNNDPATGELLRPHAKEGQRVGMDFTFNAPKSVTLLREVSGEGNLGDDRVEAAHREAVAYAMSHIEADMKCRVKGGREPDRMTGNMCAYRVTHRDTRVNPEDKLPDPHLHDHVFVMNQTFDPVEKRWFAAELGDIKHDCPFYEAIYMNRLASNIRDLGYGIRREGKSFEVAGIDRKMIDKFSRRTKQIEAVATKLGIKNPDSKAKLGATTRLGKTKELADDLNGYYVSRLTNEEKERLAHLPFEPSYATDDEKAVRYAIEHEFYTKSVVEERKLYETAIRFGVGSVTPEVVMEEALRQGVLLKDGQATTRGVLAEESCIIDFAREGKGTMRPLSAVQHTTDEQTHPVTSAALGQQKGRPDASERPRNLNDDVAGLKLHKQLHREGDDKSLKVQSDAATLSRGSQSTSLYTSGSRIDTNPPSLSTEQQALVSHVLGSRDQVILVVGDAGTGKTTAVRSAFDRIHCPVEMLAPSVDASRGVLRKEGFHKADTVASFLLNTQRQQAVKNGVIWVDEAGLLPIRDLSKLTDIAKQQNARLILQGDPKQHRSVVRHGDMMNTLQSHARLKVGRLTEVWRQKHEGYKSVVQNIATGDCSGAFDGLKYLGWVKQVEDNRPIVNEYMDNLRTGKEQLLIAPSHAEGDSITVDIRDRLRIDGKLGEDHQLDRLANLNWSPAEKGDMVRYTGNEVLVFHKNSGGFRAGEEVALKDLKGRRWKSTEHFSVFRPEKIAIAAGDTIRITGRGNAGGHTLENGMIYRVKGFDNKGRVVLNNDWVLPETFKHLAHGYVSTSYAGQGKTVKNVLIAMGSDSLGAMNAEQFYVSVSRGKLSAKVFTDLTPEELKKAIQRTDTRKSAMELMTPKKKPAPSLMRRLREHYDVLRERINAAMTKQQEKEYALER